MKVFRSQVADTRRVDRQFGGLTQLDQLRHQIDQVSELLAYTIGGGNRSILAAVLCEACTLAGWQSLDRNAHDQAWKHYERAKPAAREAGSTALLAHATAEQAFVLSDIGETALATEHTALARSQADNNSAALLHARLAAPHGETLAHSGPVEQARLAFDAAEQHLPTVPVPRRRTPAPLAR